SLGYCGQPLPRDYRVAVLAATFGVRPELRLRREDQPLPLDEPRVPEDLVLVRLARGDGVGEIARRVVGRGVADLAQAEVDHPEGVFEGRAMVHRRTSC